MVTTTLRLIREPSHNEATLGSLYIDDVRFCDTLEDQIREVPGRPTREWKIQDRTAIPAGRYRIVMRQSPHFGCVTPHLLDVDGFEYILMHWGNFAKDTSGCILVGLSRGQDEIYQSREAFNRLMQRLMKATDDIWIEIENPRGPVTVA